MNGYFQIMNGDNGTSIKLFPPTEGGERLNVNEISEYLQSKNYTFDLALLNRVVQSIKEEAVEFPLSKEREKPERESVQLYLSPDKMLLEGRFHAPSNDGGKMNKQEILDDLKYQGIVFGIEETAVEAFLQKREYCKTVVLARGKAPVQGKDARIEYYFNTDLKARPTLLEDGSVDFFHLNTINHCKAGDVLARLFPEERGEEGSNVLGDVIPPRDVKKTRFAYGKNIELSEDGAVLTSMVNGHVSLVEGRVFVSDVFEVENVDNSTGDIDYEGSVQVNGNVCSNFTVKAQGNIEIKGVVEGARVEAGGNITIARGVNGMGKGVLTAGGNIVAKFIENATVTASGYVESGSILHSHVNAQTEINVSGKRGFITGGEVCATNCINVKTLGSPMGADTVVNVGINPQVKVEFQQLQKQAAESAKVLKSVQPVIQAATQKLKQGVKLPPDQVAYIKSLVALDKQKKEELESVSKRMEELQELMSEGEDAKIMVSGTIYPGTRIMISDASMVVQKEYSYCRFVKDQGDVKMAGL